MNATLATLATLAESDFALVIKTQRERLGLTQLEAAKLCRVSARAWWKWEHGEEPLYPTMRGVLEILASATTNT